MKAMWGSLAVLLFVSACATPHWHKDGMTSESLEQDIRECDRDADRRARAEGAPGHQPQPTVGARSVGTGPSPLRAGEHQQRYEACMKTKATRSCGNAMGAE
jgi:hypothetical protein